MIPQPAPAAPHRPADASTSDPLRRAFAAAIAFPLDAGVPTLDRAKIQALADEEASFGAVGFNERGLTSGMRLHLLEPVLRGLGAWRDTRATFDRELEPFRTDLEALARLGQQLDQQKAKTRDAIADVDRRAASDKRYVTARQNWEDSSRRYDVFRARHGNRDAITWGGSFVYWITLLAVFAAEWLINYDVVLQFFGIPAIAFGTTAVLGLLVAFASHIHGMVWRQWSYRFGQHRISSDRAGDWRNLSLATLALTLVLLAAGWMRYIAAVKAGGSGTGNLLGAEAGLDIDPSRDVLVSLLANLGAWLAGCFLSLFAHDPDPEHMSATKQKHRWDRRYARADRRYVDERKTIWAKLERDGKQIEAAGLTRRQAVGAQEDMWRQVDAHEAALLGSLASTLRRSAETYRDALLRAGNARELRFLASPQQTPLTPFDVRAMTIAIDADFIRAQG